MAIDILLILSYYFTICNLSLSLSNVYIYFACMFFRIVIFSILFKTCVVYTSFWANPNPMFTEVVRYKVTSFNARVEKKRFNQLGKAEEKLKNLNWSVMKCDSPGEDGHSQANNASRLQPPRPRVSEVCCEAAVVPINLGNFNGKAPHVPKTCLLS